MDEIVLVDDDEITKAMFLLMERMKFVVEPAGAVGLSISNYQKNLHLEKK